MRKIKNKIKIIDKIKVAIKNKFSYLDCELKNKKYKHKCLNIH